jgi:hypothetical protein
LERELEGRTFVSTKVCPQQSKFCRAKRATKPSFAQQSEASPQKASFAEQNEPKNKTGLCAAKREIKKAACRIDRNRSGRAAFLFVVRGAICSLDFSLRGR